MAEEGDGDSAVQIVKVKAIHSRKGVDLSFS